MSMSYFGENIFGSSKSPCLISGRQEYPFLMVRIHTFALPPMEFGRLCAMSAFRTGKTYVGRGQPMV
ncbi:hypothetical protein DWX59_03840 [Enterocloster aldenensis]|nr:hypothetical protein DWX59_03840 [Enterocloster aldenensis]RGC64397.1 hypothetical protein DW690_01515 [Dorea longicatena]